MTLIVDRTTQTSACVSVQVWSRALHPAFCLFQQTSHSLRFRISSHYGNYLNLRYTALVFFRSSLAVLISYNIYSPNMLGCQELM